MFDDSDFPEARRPLGPALIDVVARAAADPRVDEATLVARLRAVVAWQTPGERLLACYLGRPHRVSSRVPASRPARVSGYIRPPNSPAIIAIEAE